MLVKILDTKNINGNTWALCRGSLLEYLQGLKEDFFEFSVQRKIVNNSYLDRIYTSIENGEPFPAITLTYQGNIPHNAEGKIEIDNKKVEILDGLQRTYRLWIVLFIEEMIRKEKVTDVKTFAEAIKKTREGEIILQNRFITPKFIKRFLKEEDGQIYASRLLKCYSEFDVYFNIWTGLDDRSIVDKMLILNAGQKSVSSTHQYELLFLHFFEEKKLNYDNDIRLIREKDREYRKIQRGEREPGTYLMASVVVALQSFINGKPLRIKPVNEISMDDRLLLDDEKLTDYFNAGTLSQFINVLYSFDKKLEKKSREYVKWYGKDTVLSGIFGAIGLCLSAQYGQLKVQEIEGFTEKLLDSSDPFSLKDYYFAYDNKLESTKVNVGNAVRKAIFNYTKDLLTKGKSDWYEHFSRSRNYDED